MTDESIDEPTLLFAHTVGPDRGADLRDRLVDAGIPADRVLAAATPAETDEHLADADGLVVGRLPEDLLDRADSLRWVQALSSGVDYLPVDDLVDRGIALTNAAGVHAEPIGEQVLGYMLNFERDLHALARQQADSRWERREGGELRGKAVGIVGVGAIGTRVAELTSAFGMDVWGVKRDLDSMPDAVDEPRSPDALHEVCLASDYLVLACPLTDETEGLIGGDELRLLGEDGVLVNVARGEVCDQEALVGALRSHLIRGAALDVFEEEPLPADSRLWDLSNVVVTPHMAGSTPHKAERWTEILAENYRRLAEGDSEGMRNRVV
ncbi:D-2-hydroxyacid dehydrogenase [Halobaculum saliterrae]|uniref:D-2-hydroxyacid dehydrogenase n=1 Tax=Halobaculum saliterrae TaxID=2073113 RepID=UPI00135B1970|nr:D-2-hydroxyacid dehydrogenase [Halobaculum saliterrae]